MSSVAITELVTDCQGLELCVQACQAGLARFIGVPRIQKPGLALTGYAEQLHKARLLVLGGTEIEYLAGIDAPSRRVAVDTVMSSEPAALVITRGLAAPKLLQDRCEEAGVAILSTPLDSNTFIKRVTAWLDEKLSPSTTIHGVMVDVVGVGILLRGPSGVGKSEAALDLVERGHRLVADDVVRVQQLADGTLMASSSRELGHHMEIRGLGIINIAELFGITSVRASKRLDLVIELAEWQQDAEYDRLGIDERTHTLLDTSVAYALLPVRPGRNIASIIEVAARNHLLREMGHNSASRFLERLDKERAQARVRVSD